MFGEFARLIAKVSSSTPIIQNNQELKFYYLSLEDINVSRKLLNIKKDTFRLQSYGTGSFAIVFRQTVTYLKQAGYFAVKQELAVGATSGFL